MNLVAAFSCSILLQVSVGQIVIPELQKHFREFQWIQEIAETHQKDQNFILQTRKDLDSIFSPLRPENLHKVVSKTEIRVPGAICNALALGNNCSFSISQLEEFLVGEKVSEGCAKDLKFVVGSLGLYVAATAELAVCELPSGNCSKTAKGYLLEIIYSNIWAVLQLDAQGKLPAGVLEFNLFWMGNYEECLKIQAPLNKTYETNYCLFVTPMLELITSIFTPHLKEDAGINDFQFTRGPHKTTPPPLPPTSTISPINSSNITDNAQRTGFECPKDGVLTSPTSLKFGLCVPNRCTSEDLSILSDKLANRIGLPNCVKCQQRTLPWSKSAIATLCFLSLFGLISCAATLYDYFLYRPSLEEYVESRTQQDFLSQGPQLQNYSRPTLIKDFYDCTNLGLKSLLAFSLLSNGERILNTEQLPGQIHCIHGIRFISMSWVILGHSYLFTLEYSDNFAEAVNIPKDYINQAITNATFSVDTFFLLSGLLLSYLWFKEMKKCNGEKIKSGKIWVLYYVHRYLRLTPVMGILILWSVTLMPYMTRGPMWPQNGSFIDVTCPRNWWTNMLYVNNIVRLDEACFGHTWYLANDMQFHVLAPLLLVPLWFLPPAGVGISVWLIIGSVIANAVTVLHFYLPAGSGFLGPADPRMPQHTDAGSRLMYDAPWIRYPPYIIGILLGYLMQMRPQIKLHRVKNIERLLNCLGWLIAFIVCWCILFGLIRYSQGHQLPVGVRALYSAVSRPLWSAGVAWVIFACFNGYGGPVNSFLSWSVWIPLSRLTYIAYLIHINVLIMMSTSDDHPAHWTNHFNMYTHVFLGAMAFTYFASFFISAVFEVPIAILEKLFLEPLVNKPPKPPVVPEDRTTLPDHDELQKSLGEEESD